MHNPAWSDDENKRVFGLCNNPNFHGHNYELIVRLSGEIDPGTGYVFDMKVLSDLIKEEIIHRFDHRNLNADVEDFAHLNPSAENIAVVIYQRLKARLPEKYDLEITLYETERNFVRYPA